MFDRFTERARKVIILAKEEAKRFNHDYIGTEHIPLGLIKEGESVAAAVLQNLGLSLDTIRLEIEKLVQFGPSTVISGDIPGRNCCRRCTVQAMCIVMSCATGFRLRTFQGLSAKGL